MPALNHGAYSVYPEISLVSHQKERVAPAPVRLPSGDDGQRTVPFVVDTQGTALGATQTSVGRAIDAAAASFSSSFSSSSSRSFEPTDGTRDHISSSSLQHGTEGGRRMDLVGLGWFEAQQVARFAQAALHSRGSPAEAHSEAQHPETDGPNAFRINGPPYSGLPALQSPQLDRVHFPSPALANSRPYDYWTSPSHHLDQGSYPQAVPVVTHRSPVQSGLPDTINPVFTFDAGPYGSFAGAAGSMYNTSMYNTTGHAVNGAAGSYAPQESLYPPPNINSRTPHPLPTGAAIGEPPVPFTQGTSAAGHHSVAGAQGATSMAQGDPDVHAQDPADPFRCIGCQRPYRSREALRRHIKDRMVPCQTCRRRVRKKRDNICVRCHKVAQGAA